LALKHEEKTLILLKEILIRAEPEGHIRLFLDRGAVIEEMLRHLHDPNYSNSYLSDLLCAFEVESHYARGMKVEEETPKLERLSPRELEILFLIGQGASNKEIADKLVISEGTVKTHVKHILSKLDAQNRPMPLQRLAHVPCLLTENPLLLN
jgi:LuxR family maltose regulon positive regulatory protein